MTYHELKERHRAERNTYHENLSLRVHRALSWLNRAETADDHDSQVIFLWIAFNAAYATEVDDYHRFTERETFKAFIGKLCDLDNEGKFYEQIWSDFANNIRIFLDNPFVYQLFWDYQSGKATEQEWKDSFAAQKAVAMKALGKKDTAKVISIILGRVYTLRNQLIHGGATWNSAVNRDQVREAARFLFSFIPITLRVMMDNPQTLWGDACYPVVKV